MPSGSGFHSGWVSDHVAWPSTIASHYPYSDDGSFAPPVDMPWLDPVGTLFFIAGCTETLKLGSTVLILGYRPPVLTAKAIASLDHLSEGHVILGVGVGSTCARSSRSSACRSTTRGKRADEQLELFRTLFADPTPKFAPATSTTCPRSASSQSPSTDPYRSGSAATARQRFAASPASATPSTRPSRSSRPSRPAGRGCAELVAKAGRDPMSCDCRSGSTLIRSTRCRRASRSPAARRDARHGRSLAGHRCRPHPPRPAAPGGLAGRRAAMERFMLSVTPQV